jgi:hypothetical protein
MKASERRAEAFRRLDLHDDTLLDLRLIPPSCRRDYSSLRVELLRGKDRRVLIFGECLNVVVRVDCDVLGENWPDNTSGVAADTRPQALAKFALKQRHLWDVEYETIDGRGTSPMPKKLQRMSRYVLGGTSPMPKKLQRMSRYVLYRLQFFGGRVEALARTFTLGRAASRGGRVAQKQRRRRTKR